MWFITMSFHLIIMELNSSNSKTSDQAHKVSDRLKPRAFKYHFLYFNGMFDVLSLPVY